MAVRIGELLLKEKRISPEQLQEALNYQRSNGGKLGFNLIKLGYVKDDEKDKLDAKAILDDIRADGVYWDELEYSAYRYHYGEPWDGCSADIDPGSMKIARLKSSVTLLTQPWRVEMAKKILARGPLVGNGQPHTRTMASLRFPRFVETGSPSNGALAQLHSPIALGDHLTERSEIEAYRNMLSALDFGCLYHWYDDLTVVPSYLTLTQYMYPFTPIELHEGELRVVHVEVQGDRLDLVPARVVAPHRLGDLAVAADAHPHAPPGAEADLVGDGEIRGVAHRDRHARRVRRHREDVVADGEVAGEEREGLLEPVRLEPVEPRHVEAVLLREGADDVRLRRELEVDQGLAEPDPPLALVAERGLELRLADDARLHEHLAEPLLHGHRGESYSRGAPAVEGSPPITPSRPASRWRAARAPPAAPSP